MASNIQIEQFNATPTNNGETLALTNPVSSVNSAFIRINSSSDKSSAGPIGSTANCNANIAHCGVVLTDTDELTFYKSTSTQVRIIGEVWRYVGTSGGDNEFIVRGRYAISAAGTSTSQAVSGIVNEDKCVPFMTGSQNSSGSVSTYDEVTFAVHMDGSGNVVVTSNNTSSAATVYVTVVEFTGSNWSVGHGVSSSHDTATETVTLNTDSDGTSGSAFDVDNWETAWIEASMGGDSSETGLSDIMCLVYPHADTDKVYFSVTDGDAAARNDADGWVHVIKNPSIIVKRGSGAITEGNNTYGTPIASPAGVNDETDIEEMGLEWFVDTSGTGTAHKRGSLNAYISKSVGINYNQGDGFNSTDYISTDLGIWVFSGLTFPSSPVGVLVEAGGTGTGMFVGYNDSGDFIARGGSGSSTAPSDCARIVVPTTTYDFSSRSGKLTIKIEVSTDTITLTWDEGSNDSIDYTTSNTAASSFTNWSGSNDGAVGDWAGSSIAGSEITSNYTFNGTIGNMNFKQIDGSSYFIQHWIHRSGNDVIGRWGFIDLSALSGTLRRIFITHC